MIIFRCNKLNKCVTTYNIGKQKYTTDTNYCCGADTFSCGNNTFSNFEEWLSNKFYLIFKKLYISYKTFRMVSSN